MAAMKSGLLLLLLLGLAAALGSAFYPETFYNMPLFKLLVLLLFINLTLCSLNRLLMLKKMLSKGLKSGTNLFRATGLSLLHLGLVLIIAGGGLYTYYGQSGEVYMQKKQCADISRIMRLQEPFSLRLDDFQIQFNEDGSASQYYSYITVLKNGQAVKKAAISVNHPLSYGGVKAYQTSFGYFIKVRSGNGSGEQPESLYEEGDFITLKGARQKVKVYRYLPDFDPEQGMNAKSQRPDNPHIIFSVYQNDRFRGVGAAHFGERIKLGGNQSIVFSGIEPYSVLKLKSDPGLPLVLAGGLMIMLGVSMAWLATVGKRKPGPPGIRLDERAALFSRKDEA